MPVYVYGVVESSQPLDVRDVDGVGKPPAAVRVVDADGLAAVVSDAPEDLRAKRRDLLAHQTVLEHVGATTAVVPMRFGLMAPTDESVRQEIRTHEQALHQQLDAVRGHVEFNLRVMQDEETALRRVLTENDEVRRLDELTRSDQGKYEDRIALGELISNELTRTQEETGRRIVETLRPFAGQETVSGPGGESFLNASFLVRREGADEFRIAVARMADEFGQGYGFRLRGPLPPYSFV